MQYNLKSLLIILLISPIKIYHIIKSGADPSLIAFPLLNIITSVTLAFVMRINILNQFIIAISSIIPTIISSIGTMGGTDNSARYIPIIIQLIIQGVSSLLLYNGLGKLWTFLLATLALPMLMIVLSLASEAANVKSENDKREVYR